MSTLDGLKRADGDVKRVGTGCTAAPCGHEGLIEFDPSEKSLMPYKCLTCGLTFSKNPSVSKKGADYISSKRDCLKEADKIINGERQDSHGAPEDSFTIIAGYWNVFLAAKLKALGMDVKDLLTPLDTTNMMVLFKQARKLGQKPSRDNYVDSCGYEAIGADRLSE